MTRMFGIPNCDTIKKARKWLSQHEIQYEFHDYKKQGVNQEVLTQALDKHGIDLVLNKRGTTFRNLPPELKENISMDKAIRLLTEHSSMIKRPILLHRNNIYVGFTPALYQEIFQLD